jgi:RNA polymerase sigma factor (sigma-70 family)
VSHNTERGCKTLNLEGISHNKPSENSADLMQLQDLIDRVVGQDRAAFSSLYRLVSSRVFSVAWRITGNVHLAEDVVEDTFFQVWRQAPRFDLARGTALAWILTIARSRALDARRRIPPFDELIENEQESNTDNPEHADLPDLLSVIEQNQMLYDALKSLDALPRQLLALSYFRGLSHEEIAAHTGLPLGTVKSHIRRSMHRLREILSINN